jgi:hypothetical protein
MRLFLSLLFSFISFISFGQQQDKIHIYFPSNQVKPSASSMEQLEMFAHKLKATPGATIYISGHTDQFGSDEYNNALAAKRASFVQSYLQQVAGDVNYSEIKSFGESQPVATALSKQYMNRRVEIVLLNTVATATEEKTQLPTIESVTVLEPFFIDVPKQVFDIDLDDTVSVRGTDGTRLLFSPGTIQDRQGIAARGKAQLVMKEYYAPGDIVLAGMHSVSDSGLLQTGGMFFFTIVKNGDTMSDITQKAVNIRLPVINNMTGDMNVYTSHLASDTSLWTNTETAFKRLTSYWEIPLVNKKLRNVYFGTFEPKYPEFRFENWSIGGKHDREHYVSRPLFSSYKKYSTPTKKVHQLFTRTDSNTVKCDISIKYRRRGRIEFNTRTFDTTINLVYRKAEYDGYTSRLNWINCDRFYKSRNLTDYYVATPKFDGANVIVYFKNINAYMPASFVDTQLGIRRIPAGQDVRIIAFGKKDGDFYFGKTDETITNKGKATVMLKQVNENDFHDAMKRL